ncbi:hypothetical protein ACLOJK_034491 [Asimina triloba]
MTFPSSPPPNLPIVHTWKYPETWESFSFLSLWMQTHATGSPEIPKQTLELEFEGEITEEGKRGTGRKTPKSRNRVCRLVTEGKLKIRVELDVLTRNAGGGECREMWGEFEEAAAKLRKAKMKEGRSLPQHLCIFLMPVTVTFVFVRVWVFYFSPSLRR